MSNSQTAVAPANAQNEVVTADYAQELHKPDVVIFDPANAQLPDVAMIEGQAGDFSITLEYHEFQQDEPVRGIYMGITKHTCLDKSTGQLKDIDVAVFVTARKRGDQLLKETKINGSVKFVEALKRMPQGFPFQATMTGRKQKGDRSIAMFNIVQVQPK